jgi:Rrf2 family protein
MNNIQFATALHILTLLALTKDHVSSAYIAGSIGINPAMVRKSLSTLSKHELVITREGKGGGSSLAKPAKQILLADIYKAVNTAPLLGKSNRTNSDCRVGNQINTHLHNLYVKADNSLINQLRSISLADFCNQFD